MNSIERLWCSRIGDEALVAIGQGCHQLRLLNVSGGHRIGDIGLSAIAQGCPSLVHLDVSVCQVQTILSILNRHFFICCLLVLLEALRKHLLLMVISLMPEHMCTECSFLCYQRHLFIP